MPGERRAFIGGLPQSPLDCPRSHQRIRFPGESSWAAEIVRGRDHLDTPAGERVYENRYVIWGRLRWGLLREYEVYEDTQKTEALDEYLASAGKL